MLLSSSFRRGSGGLLSGICGDQAIKCYTVDLWLVEMACASWLISIQFKCFLLWEVHRNATNVWSSYPSWHNDNTFLTIRFSGCLRTFSKSKWNDAQFLPNPLESRAVKIGLLNIPFKKKGRKMATFKSYLTLFSFFTIQIHQIFIDSPTREARQWLQEC